MMAQARPTRRNASSALHPCPTAAPASANTAARSTNRGSTLAETLIAGARSLTRPGHPSAPPQGLEAYSMAVPSAAASWPGLMKSPAAQPTAARLPVGGASGAAKTKTQGATDDPH